MKDTFHSKRGRGWSRPLERARGNPLRQDEPAGVAGTQARVEGAPPCAGPSHLDARVPVTRQCASCDKGVAQQVTRPDLSPAAGTTGVPTRLVRPL